MKADGSGFARSGLYKTLRSRLWRWASRSSSTLPSASRPAKHAGPRRFALLTAGGPAPRFAQTRRQGLMTIGPTLGLAALLAVVAVLVAFAVRPARPVTAHDGMRRVQTGVAGQNLTAGSSAVPFGLGIDVSGFGLRASLGCQIPALLDATSDGGTSWHSVSVPAAHLLRVSVTGKATGWVVGANTACASAVFFTGDGGRTWTGPSPVKGRWLATGDMVVTPSGRSTPCGPSEQVDAVAAQNAWRASAICPSRVLRTVDGGRSWAPSPIPTGRPVAVAFSSAGRGLLAMTGTGGCSSVAVAVSDDAGATWGTPACLPRPIQAPVGLAFATAGSALVTSAASSYRSSDGGVTWRPA